MSPDDSTKNHRRRVRYSGTHPRRFDHKYKEHDPARHPETIAKVLASGKTPAGSHRPIMAAEVLDVLRPGPGLRAVDATLGWGGHAQAMLPRLLPGGHLVGIDADPVELPKTEVRLRAAGFGPGVFTARRENFAALPRLFAEMRWASADLILADLGLSSMQLDDPSRGFTMKHEGPLDMRMNPRRSPTAAEWLRTAPVRKVVRALSENADEPASEMLGPVLAGKHFQTTTELAQAISAALPHLPPAGREAAVRRVFQALRIAVNDEFSALDTFLRNLPACLGPGGRVAVLTFHSGEDRRVKKAFEAGLREGSYSAMAAEVVRASPEERRVNPRAQAAKLRWAERAGR